MEQVEVGVENLARIHQRLGDDAIDVMYETGHDLQSAYRETARGGLASLWRKRAAAEPRPPTPDAGRAAKC